MFGIQEFPRFSLYVISPIGEKWTYYGLRNVMSLTYGVEAKLFLSVPPATDVTGEMYLWWGHIVPPQYQHAFEKIPSGSYKMYASYETPVSDNIKKTTLYSDTVQFVFLPLKQELLPLIKDLDSIKLTLNSERRAPQLKKLIMVDSPYREALWALFITSLKDPDLLVTEKKAFDKIYPKSQFRSFLLGTQYLYSRESSMTNKVSNADSLLIEWLKETPTSLEAVNLDKNAKFLSTKELGEK